jgi:hypothetical protein
MLTLAVGAVATQAETQVSIGISVPGVSIGINTPQYPQFVRVPNYPVYYAPQQQSNYFFYDGLYWVYQRDNWYSSSWYDGPWYAVSPQRVPVYVLRVPVRYYRDPPPYFGGWQRDAPPRWGEHWGNDWQRQRSGWDRWNRSATPAPAPLPRYQREYSGERYPRVEQQQDLQGRNYRYRPRDAAVREQVQGRAPQRGNEGRPQGLPDAQDMRRPPAPERAQSRGEGNGQGNSQGNSKNKGRDKDREDADAPGQQRKQ